MVQASLVMIVIFDRHIFIVQATSGSLSNFLGDSGVSISYAFAEI